MQIREEILTCDVLVAGGGIGGLMAAIAAADEGAKVIVCDKADTRRSGSGATGNDHFNCYIPEIHGDDMEECLSEFKRSMVGGHSDESIQRIFLRRSLEVVEDWERWGIQMKPSGRYEFNGHAFPNRLRVFLKYDGYNQKEVLTLEARKRGVTIVNKTPIHRYLTDKKGKIVGAIGICIDRTVPAVQLIQAKAVISCTGNTSRLYPSITGGWMFNTAHCPSNAAGGRVAAYQAGAALVNLEIPNTHAGPKYFARCGKSTWIGLISNTEGKPIGPFVTKPTKELGDVTADVWHDVFTDKVKDGTGPVYMNCTQTAPEDLAYMMWGLQAEGDTSLIDAMEKQDIDLTKDMVEFTRYEPIMIGRGIQIDENAATNVPGLYAAGDEVGNFRADIAGAAVMGRIAGEHAARYVKQVEEPALHFEKMKEVQQAVAFYRSLLERESGSSWKELNIAVQQIMQDYAGIQHVRSETMLMAGYAYLEALEQQANKSVKCHDAHELMRALEAFDLLFIGKLVCKTAIERKETRGMHMRSDYTFTNPLLDGMFLTVQLEHGRDKLIWRKSH